MQIEKRKQSALMAGSVLGPLSHPTRLLIVCLLLDGERNAGELQALAGSSKGNISQHLSLLRSKGLIEGRRDANRIIYRIADQRLHRLVKTIQDLWCPGLAVA
jgi:DNA-binding transcriptional ArsR family regulator